MRILLMPIDAWKTNKQVHGGAGLSTLLKKARQVHPHAFCRIYCTNPNTGLCSIQTDPWRIFGDGRLCGMVVCIMDRSSALLMP